MRRPAPRIETSPTTAMATIGVRSATSRGGRDTWLVRIDVGFAREGAAASITPGIAASGARRDCDAGAGADTGTNSGAVAARGSTGGALGAGRDTTTGSAGAAGITR